MHFNGSLLLYLHICVGCFNIFFIVFRVRKPTFIPMFLKSLVICLTSLPQYVNVSHFVFWCLGSACMLCFYSCVVFFQLCLCNTRSFVICFNGDFFVSIDLLVIGYV
jgi:hypothetical protein